MKRKKTIVAMSGGVDSSVAALLLKKQGFEVTGVFMNFGNKVAEEQISNKCCSQEAEIRAKKVAGKLKIPFYVLDFRKEFKEYIINYFIEEYKKGLTPNPCVECNRKIKFGFLLNKVLNLEADFLATGHYIKLKAINEKLKVKYKLFRAKDKKKDQSYFLYNLNQEKLSHLLFPVGDYNKDEVRKIASQFGLPTAKTKESQDICFIPEGGLEIFLKYNIKNIKPGLIVDVEGNKVGRHQGLSFYTIGQRKGIKIGGGKPYYVVETDIKNNILVVTDNNKDKRLFCSELEVFNINWLSGSLPKIPCQVESVIRYRQEPVQSEIISYNKFKKSCLIRFQEPQRAKTLGQSTVFYKKDELLGGGIIS